MSPNKSELDDEELKSLDQTAPSVDVPEADDALVEETAPAPFAPSEDSSEWETPSSGRNWRRIASYAGIAVVVLVLAVLLGRWVHHRSLREAKPAATTQQAPSDLLVKNSQNGKQGAGNNKPSTASNNGSTPATSTLPQTGPGDVLAVFVGSSAAGAGLHYAVRRRQTR